MKVDLEALRRLIEEEIGRVEKQKTRLQQQLQHISAVEQLATEAEANLRVVEEPKRTDSSEPELSEQSRKWFQQV